MHGFLEVSGQEGDDVLFGGDGDDFVSGGKGDDVADGGAGDDAIVGGLGDDALFGGDGRDFLFGGRDGNDSLDGGAGIDTLQGGRGDDELSGGGGRDVFLFRGAFGDDVVTDFVEGVDRLAIRADDIDDITVETTGEGVFLTVDGDRASGTILLLGVGSIVVDESLIG